MNESQLRAHLLALFEKCGAIEKKYGDGLITGADDLSALEGYMVEIKSGEEQLQTIKAQHDQRVAVQEGLKRYGQPSAAGVPPIPSELVGAGQYQGKSLGDLFYEHDDIQRLLKGNAFAGSSLPQFSVTFEGASLLAQAERKTLAHTTATGLEITAAGPFPSVQRQAGYLPLLYAELSFLDALSRQGFGEELLEWVIETGFTSAAAETAEATATTGTSGTKPEAGPITFEVTSQSVVDIPHWMPVTNKMLRANSTMRGIINTRLQQGIDRRLQTQCMGGDGVAPNLKGLLTYSGVKLVGKGSDSIVDAIHKALTKIRVETLVEPSVVFMNPLDWQRVRLAKNAVDGNYYYGPPFESGQSGVWGKPVIRLDELAEGTAIVGDMSQMTLFDRERTTIRTGTINDQFIRNMQTILAEMACLLAVWRPDGFCKVTGLNA